ncbi:hypothetical protein ACFWXK_38260 [Streptomyces sp. NPDC059070]|uniref:hypothetical protein n=1 Tax=Streptomyces sp. NPDC059070 TaxID=3346713 RepID=UPI0036A64E9D
MNPHTLLDLVTGDWPGHSTPQALARLALLAGLLIALYAAGSTPPAPHDLPSTTTKGSRR